MINKTFLESNIQYNSMFIVLQVTGCWQQLQLIYLNILTNTICSHFQMKVHGISDKVVGLSG